ncbi:MAG: rRNA maturation RNase YbeY [Acidobacteriaceae bacterium]
MIEPPSTRAASDGLRISPRTLRKTELQRFLALAQAAVGLKGEVHVLLSDDATLKQLNKAFRHKNKPTDVLSFPAAEMVGGIAGDLAISLETAAKQAAEFGHTLHEEVKILLLHGLLHLAGYDHETDNGEMAAKEQRLRKRLELSASLIQRVQTEPVKKAARKAAAKRKVTR